MNDIGQRKGWREEDSQKTAKMTGLVCRGYTPSAPSVAGFTKIVPE